VEEVNSPDLAAKFGFFAVWGIVVQVMFLILAYKTERKFPNGNLVQDKDNSLVIQRTTLQ